MDEETTPWSPDQLRSLWSQMESTIHPFIHVLCISGDLFRAMNKVAKDFVAMKFMEHVTESVLFCKDGTGNDRYFLGAPKHFTNGVGMLLSTDCSEPIWILRPDTERQTAEVCPPCLPRKPSKIPRPPNAYILYRKERHNAVKAANPGVKNNEISQILGRAWNMEAASVRKKYKDMANDVKEALLEKHPDYQYRPRKPSEKKKRQKKPQNVATPMSPGPSSPDSVAISMSSPL